MENLMHQLQEYFYNQFPIIEQNNLIVIITALVIALLYVFFGYKLLRVYISLLGFLIGFALGIVICAVFDLSNTTAVIVIICVCAVALAALVDRFDPVRSCARNSGNILRETGRYHCHGSFRRSQYRQSDH